MRDAILRWFGLRRAEPLPIKPAIPMPKVGPEIELIELGSGEWQAQLRVPGWLSLVPVSDEATHYERSGAPRRTFETRDDALAAGRVALARWRDAQVVKRETVVPDNEGMS